MIINDCICTFIVKLTWYDSTVLTQYYSFVFGGIFSDGFMVCELVRIRVDV